MNAINPLFDVLPIPGSGDAATPPLEAALPALIPTASSFDDNPWAEIGAPEEDWGPEDAPPPGDEYAATPTWEECQDEVSTLAAHAQANAAVARTQADGAASSGRPTGPAWGTTVSDPTELIRGLNPAQESAVTHAGTPLLIIADAGPGKTRVLTHHIVRLIATRYVHPGEILVITFTNKAAAEIRERVTALVGPAGERIQVSTFHSACMYILCREHEAAGLRSAFPIYDTADPTRLITLIVRELSTDPKRFIPKTFAHRISDPKNELITPAQFAEHAVTSDPLERHLAEICRAHAQRLSTTSTLDFDNIITRTVSLLQTRPVVAEIYRCRFCHILADEYQDTNHTQYVSVRKLVGRPGTSGADSTLPPGELTVVGDSDQSVYAFRGATIRNIEEFEEDYPSTRTILLEQNYRSTQNILSATSAIISRNNGRREKNLWTAAGDGAPITGCVAGSERDEARRISQGVDYLTDEHGVRPHDIAVFYRTNAQSRALEETFVRADQPYKVIDGTRSYGRREIRNAIAYLCAVDNPDNDVNLRHVLNVPKRGLGDKAEGALTKHAARCTVSFGQAVADAVGAPREAQAGETENTDGQDTSTTGTGEPPEVRGLTTRIRNQVHGFYKPLTTLRHMVTVGDDVADVLDFALDTSSYLAELRASDDPQDAARVENLAELHSVASGFQVADPDGTLADFLERVSLVADSNQLPPNAGLEDEDARQAEEQSQITLVTVHITEGLEFPVVFVTGMEDGTFPHARFLTEGTELTRERHLIYVVLTHARGRLYLTRTTVHSTWEAADAMPASRFLGDVPDETIDWKRLTSSVEALHNGGTGWGSNRSKGNFSSGGRRSGSSRQSPYSDDDGFTPPVGTDTKRLGKPGRVETAQDQAAKRASAHFEARGKQVIPSPAGAASGDLPTAVAGLRTGDQVRHDSYGVGAAVGLEGEGRSLTTRIGFVIDGVPTTRRLILRYTPVAKI